MEDSCNELTFSPKSSLIIRLERMAGKDCVDMFLVGEQTHQGLVQRVDMLLKRGSDFLLLHRITIHGNAYAYKWTLSKLLH